MNIKLTSNTRGGVLRINDNCGDLITQIVEAQDRVLAYEAEIVRKLEAMGAKPRPFPIRLAVSFGFYVTRDIEVDLQDPRWPDRGTSELRKAVTEFVKAESQRLKELAAERRAYSDVHRD